MTETASATVSRWVPTIAKWHSFHFTAHYFTCTCHTVSGNIYGVAKRTFWLVRIHHYQMYSMPHQTSKVLTKLKSRCFCSIGIKAWVFPLLNESFSCVHSWIHTFMSYLLWTAKQCIQLYIHLASKMNPRLESKVSAILIMGRSIALVLVKIPNVHVHVCCIKDVINVTKIGMCQ